MAVMMAAVAGIVLGTAPTDCACEIPGYTLNAAQSLCISPSKNRTCTPDVDLCPRAVRSAAPLCKGTSGSRDASLMSGITGFLYVGEPLWLSLPQSQVVSVPEVMEGMPTWVADHMVVPGEIKQVCPSSSRVPGCRFYAFVYGCETNCKADSDLDVLASVLTPLGYEVASCAPSFRQFNNGEVHEMKAFVKHVEPGTSVAFTIPSVMRHMMTSIDRAAHDCASLSPAECVSPFVSGCKLDATNTCVTSLCKKPTFVGPPLTPPGGGNGVPPTPPSSGQGPQLPASCGVCPSKETA